jgi:hypothetical protein
MTITINGSPSGTELITGDPTSIFLPGGGLSVVGSFPTVATPAASGALKVVTSPFVLTSPVSTAPATVYAITSYSTFTPAGALGGQSGTGRHVSFTKNASQSGTNGTPTSTLFTSAFPFGSSEVGSITSSGTGNFTSFTTTSDHRLKENVTPVENGLDYIMPLRPRKFSWKQGGAESVGFIAHELQEDFPPHLDVPLVTGEKDAVQYFVNLYKDGEILSNDLNEPLVREIPFGQEAERLSSEGYTWVIVEENQINQGISTRSLISPIVASVQQLNSLITEQQTEIEEIKLRIAALKVKKNV